MRVIQFTVFACRMIGARRLKRNTPASSSYQNTEFHAAWVGLVVLTRVPTRTESNYRTTNLLTRLARVSFMVHSMSRNTSFTGSRVKELSASSKFTGLSQADHQNLKPLDGIRCRLLRVRIL